MLANNQLLVHLGYQFSKLKSINQQVSSLAADKFYAMSQALIPKASPEAISFGGGLMVGVILESLGINCNNIVSGIPNVIPIPSSLRYMVKKACEDSFMRIAGVLFGFTCSMA